MSRSGRICLKGISTSYGTQPTSCIHHPDPAFAIGNNYSQPVTVYFEGQKVGRLKPGEHEVFFPNEVLTDTDLLLELKSDSGIGLYHRLFTWDELLESIEDGKIYWIGDGK